MGIFSGSDSTSKDEVLVTLRNHPQVTALREDSVLPAAVDLNEFNALLADVISDAVDRFGFGPELARSVSDSSMFSDREPDARSCSEPFNAEHRARTVHVLTAEWLLAATVSRSAWRTPMRRGVEDNRLFYSLLPIPLDADVEVAWSPWELSECTAFTPTLYRLASVSKVRFYDEGVTLTFGDENVEVGAEFASAVVVHLTR